MRELQVPDLPGDKDVVQLDMVHTLIKDKLADARNALKKKVLSLFFSVALCRTDNHLCLLDCHIHRARQLDCQCCRSRSRGHRQVLGQAHLPALCPSRFSGMSRC